MVAPTTIQQWVAKTLLLSRLLTEPARLVLALQKLGPYLLVGLLLPGGSVIAVLVWLYRRHGKPASASS